MPHKADPLKQGLEDRGFLAFKIAIAKYNLRAVPFLEPDGSVTGFVTVDDVIDVLIEEQTGDLLQMAAVEPCGADRSSFARP